MIHKSWSRATSARPRIWSRVLPEPRGLFGSIKRSILVAGVTASFAASG